MKHWLTAQEIADLKLDGFPASERGVQKYAEREGWTDTEVCRKRQGREGGGGLEYYVELLPLPQRLQYAGTFVRVEQDDCLTEAGGDLTARERSARDARMIVLRVAERFRKSCGLGAVGSDHLFTQLYEDGKVPVPDWAREHVKRLSNRTLARWRKSQREDVNQLAHDPSKARKGTGVLDRAEGGELKAFCLALHVKNDFFTAEHIRDTAIEEFGETVLVETSRGPVRKSMPPLRTFQNALKRWKEEHENDLLKFTDPDAYKSKVRFAMAGGHKANRLNEVWEIDASPIDVMTTDGRKNLYISTDLYSRRLIILVTDTPRAAAVGLLIRKCLIAWGVPEIIKTDNGSDFTAKATTRLLDALGIEQELSPPYTPEKKGTVERSIKTFQHDCAVTLPGFIGHSVADRKRIESRKAFSVRLGTNDAKLFQVELSGAELQETADWWAHQKYAHKRHSGLKNKTPFQVAQASQEEIGKVRDLAALDVLLAPIAGKNGIRKVTKTGLKIDNEVFVTFDVPVGESVLCRENPEDQGRIWLFDPEGETYLGEALCPDLLGMDRAETAAKMRAMQKAEHEEKTADIRKAMRKITPRTVMEAQRRRYQHNADVLDFPKPTVDHETTKTLAAADAKAPRVPKPLSDAEREVLEQLQADVPPIATVTPLNTFDTPEKRFTRAKQLERRIAEGTKLSEKDAVWLTDYQTDPEYRARKQLEEDLDQHQQVPPA